MSNVFALGDGKGAVAKLRLLGLTLTSGKTSAGERSLRIFLDHRYHKGFAIELEQSRGAGKLKTSKR